MAAITGTSAQSFGSFTSSGEGTITPVTTFPTRSINAATLAELTSDHLTAAILAKLEFDSGDSHIWTGLGTLSYDGDTYLGTGILGSISAISESQELRANGTTLRLSGVPSSQKSLALAEDYQGRPARLWFATINPETGLIIGEPYQLLSGKMDVMTIVADGDTATIELTVESELVDLQKPSERRYTAEDQKIDYPNDKFFDFVPSIQDKEISWGQSND